MISSGSGTNSRLRARASCSIPILTKEAVPFGGGVAGCPQPFRRSHSGAERRLLYDHIESLYAPVSVFPARRQSLGRNARILGCRRGFHGRSVRKLYDRRYGDRPGFHAGLLCLFSETSQTQLYARSGTLASSGEIPAATGSASATVTAGRREAAKSDAPASRDANPKPEAISSES